MITRLNSLFPQLFLLIILLGTALAPGCLDDGDNPERTLTLGLLMPVTGSGSSTGESMLAAAELARADVNAYLAATGSDLKLEFSVRDTRTEPGQTLAAVQELDGEGIRYIVGPYASAGAAAVLDYVGDEGIVLLSPSSVASNLAVAGDNLFRLAPSDRNQAVAMAAMFDRDTIQTVIPVVRDDLWGDGLIADVIQVLNPEGKKVLDPIRYDPAAVDAAGIAAQLAGLVSQEVLQTPASRVCVYMLSFGEGTEILAAAAQEPDCALVRWYGSSAFANNAGLPADPVAAAFALQQRFTCPVFGPDPSAADLWTPISQQLTSELGRSPEVYALTAYDAIWLYAQAYNECGDPSDTSLFKATLVEVARRYFGITGRTTFDDAGDRRFASFEFWGLSFDDADYDWKAIGHYNNADGTLVVY